MLRPCSRSASSSPQACLQALLDRFGCPAISLSEPFEEWLALLRLTEKRGLEDVVRKRGECRDWVKMHSWREANRDRFRLFEKA